MFNDSSWVQSTTIYFLFFILVYFLFADVFLEVFDKGYGHLCLCFIEKKFRWL